MSVNIIRPSTLEGIKRLAKAIKQAEHIPHYLALDRAAQAAGFQNLRHARRALIDANWTGRTANPLYVTAYWRTRNGETGRETLFTHTREAWATELQPRELGASRGLRLFRLDASDHLETRRDIADQAAARNVACAAVRILQFMDATGLRPLTRNARDFERVLRDLPGKDHASYWVDPRTSEVILTDEPYNSSDAFIEHRNVWAARHNLEIVRVRWPGMYAPGSSTLYLVGGISSRLHLEALARRLGNLSSPPVADDWQGESAPYAPVLITPGRKADGRVKRARPRPIYPGESRNGALAYGGFPGGMGWRPQGRMPIASHKEIARLLKEIGLAEKVPARAHHKLGRVKCDLDDWVQREYKERELPSEEFFELYYGGIQKESCSNVREAIDRISDLLSRGYGDCTPLRQTLQRLKSARNLVT